MSLQKIEIFIQIMILRNWGIFHNKPLEEYILTLPSLPLDGALQILDFNLIHNRY